MPHSIRESRPPLEVAAADAHVLTARYRARVDASIEIIKNGLSLAPDAYVALSLGKDSAAMAHLCLQVNPQITLRLVTYPESNLIDNYEETARAFEDRYKATIEVIRIERDHSMVVIENRSVMNQDDRAGAFVGLRKSESRPRKLSLTQHGVIHAYAKTGVYRICPMADWSDTDIAACIIANNIPVLKTYHELGLQARTAAKIPVRNALARADALNKLRLSNYAAFEALARMFPEVREWV